MANRIVSRSCDERRDIDSPNLSKTPSVTSFDSMLSDKFEASLGDQGAPHMATMAESQPTHMASQVIEPNGIRISTTIDKYPEADSADHESSFMRHDKYFFKDGNVKFLLRDVQSSK